MVGWRCTGSAILDYCNYGGNTDMHQCSLEMLSQLFLFFLKHLNFLSSILKGSKQLVLFSTYFLAVKLPWEFIQLEMGAANAAPFLGLINDHHDPLCNVVIYVMKSRLSCHHDFHDIMTFMTA